MSWKQRILRAVAIVIGIGGLALILRSIWSTPRGETVNLWAVACRTALGPAVLDNVYVSYTDNAGARRYVTAGDQVLSVPGTASVCLEQLNGGHACMDGGKSPQAELVHMGRCGSQRSENDGAGGK